MRWLAATPLPELRAWHKEGCFRGGDLEPLFTLDGRIVNVGDGHD
jgi:hypothetical protein